MFYNRNMSQMASLEISFEDFLQQAPETSIMEWVDDRVIARSLPSEHHQDVSDF